MVRPPTRHYCWKKASPVEDDFRADDMGAGRDRLSRRSGGSVRQALWAHQAGRRRSSITVAAGR